MLRAPAYRLPDSTQIGRVVLQVADLARSLAWYERVLGLRVIERAATRARLGAQGGDRTLVELRERAGARPVPRRGLLGLYHFAILLPDRASLGRFLTHIASLGVPAGMSDHLVSEAIYLQDPDNLGIEVYADRPRATWAFDGDQLAMASNPLDAQAVVAAAGNGEWSGMPPGTRIGHIHLHVADIPAAERFYHVALGLDKTVWSYPGALFLSAGGYHHHLGVNTWARGAPSATAEDARLIEWELALPSAEDVREASASLTNAGYPVESDLARDPVGTAVRLTRKHGTES